MIPVADALDRILALLAPLPAETVPLREAHGRVLAETALARRAQPPFRASAMDGYALRGAQAKPGSRFRVIGESAAGRGYPGSVVEGETVRIFTGAPVPDGADRVVLQEDVNRDGATITLGHDLDAKSHIREAGSDFAVGTAIPAPRRLTPNDIALLASMNVAELAVTRRAEVAILSTGDELVMPGEVAGNDQIFASNAFGLAALVERAGAVARILPIARDTRESLADCLALVQGADLLVTTGGASVGEHDLLAQAGAELGIERSFYKVAMRPGKPLMAGRIRGTPMIGLPGNPVSSMVCGTVFVLPALERLAGLPAGPAARRKAPLGVDVGGNAAREHYMRAVLRDGTIIPAANQSSHLQRSLAEADVLIVRPPGDPPRSVGDPVDFIPLWPGLG